MKGIQFFFLGSCWKSEMLTKSFNTAYSALQNQSNFQGFWVFKIWALIHSPSLPLVIMPRISVIFVLLLTSLWASIRTPWLSKWSCIPSRVVWASTSFSPLIVIRSLVPHIPAKCAHIYPSLRLRSQNYALLRTLLWESRLPYINTDTYFCCRRNIWMDAWMLGMVDKKAAIEFRETIGLLSWGDCLEDIKFDWN